MRSLQIVILILAIVAFVVAVFFTGTETGLTLWYTGVALLLIDMVVCLIWPTGGRRAQHSD
jgi:hypothetical protein